MNAASPVSREGSIIVACGQFAPVFADVSTNLAEIARIARDAAAAGARLLVLPELCTTGYVFRSRAEARSLAEAVPSGPTAVRLAEIARQNGLHMAVGIAERDGERLYNSAALFSPDGHLGTYRKMHLWGEETLWFERGDLGFPVFATELGRVAMLICYDGWFPEAWRLCALQGAEIVLVPTNWVPMSNQPPGREAMANVLCMAAAHVNSVFVAAADRIGTERDQPFIGQSLIVGCDGWPLAGPAPTDVAELLLAKVDLADARRARSWNTFNQPLRDRRHDHYGPMLGSDAVPGWH